MPAQRKKKEEKQNLIAVLERLGLGRYEVTCSERPDFLVRFDNGDAQLILGCELTNLYSDKEANLGSPQRRFLREWRKFESKLRERFAERGHQGISGVVTFKRPAPDALDSIPQDQLDQFIAELLNLSESQEDTTNEITFAFPVEGYNLLNKHLKQLSLNRDDEPGISWRASHIQSGPVPDPQKHILDVVVEKAEKARSYNWGDASEKWLIIIAEAKTLADVAIQATIADPGVSERFQHEELEFTRIILWDRFQDELVQLFPTYAKLCDSRSQRRNFDNYPQALAPFIVSGDCYPTRAKGG